MLTTSFNYHQYFLKGEVLRVPRGARPSDTRAENLGQDAYFVDFLMQEFRETGPACLGLFAVFPIHAGPWD